MCSLRKQTERNNELAAAAQHSGPRFQCQRGINLSTCRCPGTTLMTMTDSCRCHNVHVLQPGDCASSLGATTQSHRVKTGSMTEFEMLDQFIQMFGKKCVPARRHAGVARGSVCGDLPSPSGTSPRLVVVTLNLFCHQDTSILPILTRFWKMCKFSMLLHEFIMRYFSLVVDLL